MSGNRKTIRLVAETCQTSLDTLEFMDAIGDFTLRDRRAVRALVERVYTVSAKDGAEAAMAVLDRACA